MEVRRAAYFAVVLGCGFPIIQSLHYTSPLIISKAPSTEAWALFRLAFRTYCYKRYFIDKWNTSTHYQSLLKIPSDEHTVSIWIFGSYSDIFNMDTLEYRDLRMENTVLFKTMESLTRYLFQKIAHVASYQNSVKFELPF